jgi:hypothetical protein
MWVGQTYQEEALIQCSGRWAEDHRSDGDRHHVHECRLHKQTNTPAAAYEKERLPS